MADVIVIGAGPAGMLASIIAAGKGKSVILLDRKDNIGKKLLATGNGKCNFTNTDMNPDKFNGSKELVESIIPEFDYKSVIAFMEKLGIFVQDKNGYIYPNSGQASSVLLALRMELNRLKVDIRTGWQVTDIRPLDDTYQIKIHDNKTDKNTSLSAGRIIIATGLKASPNLGSDGSMFKVIEKLGHHFTAINPALCGFYCSGLNFKKISGVRCQAHIKALVDGKVTAEDKGELQLADYGISGIPVFQVSHQAAIALEQGRKVSFCIDFMPEMEADRLYEIIQRMCSQVKDKRSINELLCGMLNQKLTLELIHSCGLSPDKKALEMADEDIKALVEQIKNTHIKGQKARGFEFAQVCSGGIESSEVDLHTLESKLYKNIFFAGEILDVDGICGGYNLQWAWSSGYIAGQGAGR